MSCRMISYPVENKLGEKWLNCFSMELYTSFKNPMFMLKMDCCLQRLSSIKHQMGDSNFSPDGKAFSLHYWRPMDANHYNMAGGSCRNQN